VKEIKQHGSGAFELMPNGTVRWLVERAHPTRRHAVLKFVDVVEGWCMLDPAVAATVIEKAEHTPESFYAHMRLVRSRREKRAHAKRRKAKHRKARHR
jgi:hypothetical protein